MAISEVRAERTGTSTGDASVRIEGVIETCRKWLYMPDDTPLKVALAVVLTAREPGDPLWMFVVGPSGDLKTELLRTLGTDNERVMMITNATPQSLLSGLSKKQGGRGLDLLPKIDGKTLVIRDFTTFMSKRPEQVNELLGRFRTYYDGEYSDNWGSIGNKSGRSHFNLLAATTSEIDRFSPVNQKLGERFLKIRTDTDEEKAGNYAAMNAGKEDAMRDELKDAVQEFLEGASSREVTVPEESRHVIIEMARFLAFLRTPVSRNRNGILTGLPQPEKPGRLVKQLIKLGKGLAMVNGNAEAGEKELQVIGRVVWDASPPIRRRILGAFRDSQESVSHGELRDRTKLPKSTLSRELEDLQLIGLLERRMKRFSFKAKPRDLLTRIQKYLN